MGLVLSMLKSALSIPTAVLPARSVHELLVTWTATPSRRSSVLRVAGEAERRVAGRMSPASGSETANVLVTSLLYQPLVGLGVGPLSVITGAVLSMLMLV